MRFLLDTNLLSETMRVRPDPGVTAWMRSQVADELVVSVLSLGEIRRGVILRAPGRRKEMLRKWLAEDIPQDYTALPVDEAIALEWGRLTAEARAKGRPIPETDALLVATALALGLTIVTRNERHCAGWGAPHINPWSGETSS